MPHRYPAWYVDGLSRDCYNTDVPTLLAKIDHLERAVRRRNDHIIQRDAELKLLKKRNSQLDGELVNLKHRYSKLRTNFDALLDAYDRVKEALAIERRRWRRV